MKPHFFKPILPGFKHGLKVPIGFLKYLKGHDHVEYAILRRTGKKWLVKVNGHRFEDGWAEFVEQHDLQLGDMLVFKHEKDMEFDVSIFDSTHCDTEYPEYLQLQEEEEEEEEEEETAKKFDHFEEKPKPNTMSSREAVPNVEAAKGLHLSHSHFVCTMKSYCISKCFLRVPSPFARFNDLRNRKCTITIMGEQRSWMFSLYSCGDATYIGGGWRNFCIANCLKEGDRLMFEIIANGKKPILKFRDLRGKVSLQPEGKTSNLDTEKVSTQEKRKPNIISSREVVHSVEALKDMHHFSCIMKSYCLSRRFLQLPNAFARLNGLSNRRCPIMIRDEQRSWMFRLYSTGKHTCIGGVWRDFCVANCLKEGDHVMFQIEAQGKKPILKFRGKSSGKDAKHERSP